MEQREMTEGKEREKMGKGEDSDSGSDAEISVSELDFDKEEEMKLTKALEEEVEEKRGSWLFHSKKAIMGKATSSRLGKALFVKFLDKESVMLLNTVKVLVEKLKGHKKAKEVKQNITKLATKILLLYDAKILKDESFEGLIFTFRRICSAVRNGFRTKELDEATAIRIHSLVMDFEKGIAEVLKSYVSKKTLGRLKSTVEEIGSVEWWLKASKEPEFDQVVCILAYYLEQTRAES